jgi:TRAP-type mannitol/chloroaromatic compound transport system permease small subunit
MDATGDGTTALVRMFGWGMLGLLAAFLVNAVLTFWVGFPGPSSILSGGGVLAALQIVLYGAGLGLGIFYVRRAPGLRLRDEATRVEGINTYLIRAAFWVVLLVGLGDALVSFLRVQGFLEAWVGADLAGDLGRSQFRGAWFHGPLVLLGFAIAAVKRGLGFIWLALLVVLAELLIVITRFVFSYEQAFMSDLVRFWYGALFLFASAYTLYDDAHVRVDLFYAGMARARKGMVNAWGSILLGMVLCWTILVIGFSSASSIIVGPILVYEVTQSGFGMYVKYFMAGFLAVFAVTMLIQFVAQLFESVADMRGEAGAREAHAEMM